MDMASLQKAVAGQIAGAAPVSSNPEIAAYFAPSFALDDRKYGDAGNFYNAGIQAEADKAALKQRASEIQDEMDPDKYQVVRKEDGGYDFFDPKGQQIDIATYTRRTGKRAVDVLKDSDNPIDQQYLNDYNNLQDYMTALQSKDKAKLDAIEAEAEANGVNLKKYKGEGGIDRLLRDFKKHYKRYYVPRSVDQNAWGANPGSQLIPNAGVAESNAAYGGGAGSL